MLPDCLRWSGTNAASVLVYSLFVSCARWCDAVLIAVKQMGYVRTLEHYTNICAGSISNPYLLATLKGISCG